MLLENKCAHFSICGTVAAWDVAASAAHATQTLGEADRRTDGQEIVFLTICKLHFRRPQEPRRTEHLEKVFPRLRELASGQDVGSRNLQEKPFEGLCS